MASNDSEPRNQLQSQLACNRGALSPAPLPPRESWDKVSFESHWTVTQGQRMRR